MAHPGPEASVIEQNVWTFAYEEVMAQTIPRSNRDRAETIAADAEQHADAVLAKHKKENA